MLLNDIRVASAATIILSGQAVKAAATSPCFTTLAVKCFLARPCSTALAHFSQQEGLDITNICLLRTVGCQSVHFYSSHNNQRELSGMSVSVLSQTGGILWEVGKTKLGLTSAFDILSRCLSGSCGPQGLETCSSLSSTL